MATDFSIWLFTPADQSQITLAGDFSKAMQLPVDIALPLNLPPEPLAVPGYYLISRSVPSDFEWIAQRTRPADVDAFSAIRFAIDDVDHSSDSFLEITSY